MATPRSASGGLTSTFAVATSLFGLMSFGETVASAAVLMTNPAETASSVIWIDAEPGKGRSPTVQMPLTGSYVPVPVALTKSTPIGSGSRIVMPVAGKGPRLLAVIVLVKVCPTRTALLSVDFKTAMSVVGTTGLSVVEPASLLGLKSGWSRVVIVALLTIALAVSMRSVMVSVAEPPTASAGMLHVPAAELYVPTDGAAEMNVAPRGVGSLTTMLRASLGPALPTVIVYTTLLPTTGVELSTVLVSERSAATGMVAVAGSDTGFCPIGVVPIAVAVLVRNPSAAMSCWRMA